jgi:hypothetical protein
MFDKNITKRRFMFFDFSTLFFYPFMFFMVFNSLAKIRIWSSESLCLFSSVEYRDSISST